MRTALALSLFLLACASPVWAQANANKGEIAGTVFDANRAVVPNANVTIKNAGTGLQRDLTTNESGQYRAVALDPGVYTITANSSGFAPATVEAARLTVGSSLAIDITLQVQSTTTTVDVAESLIALIPAPSTTLDTKAISNLPINGRRFQDFAVLTPTVQVDPSRGQLSFAGQRGINSNIMLDGADYNQPFFGGIRGGERSNFIITVPQSAIQEFQVVTTGYSAEYGRSTGGVMNTITKSGTNEIHGEAFYQLRHKSLGKKDPVQLVRSLETLQQYGGGVGGPVIKEKLFFFGAIERQQSKTPRQVFFASLVGRSPTATTQEAFDFFNGLQQPFKQTNNATAGTMRADYQTKKGNRLTFRYSVSDASAENAVSVGTSIVPFTSRALSNDGIEKDRIHNGGAQYTHIFSPNVVNDFRFTGSYEERPRLSNSETPQVDVRTIGYFGARNFLPTTQNDKRFQFSDALSITHGAHTFKVGFDINKLSAAQIFGFNQFGGFAVSSSDVNLLMDILSVGGNVANRFDDRSVSYSRQLGNLTAAFGMKQLGAFAQDSWRVNSKLTLDFGVRWEGQLNPGVEANNTDVINRIKGYRFPNGMTLDPTYIPDATKQFMPRFGFSWSPFGANGRRTVVRGHTGLFYASTPLIVFASPTNNFRTPPGDVSITLNPTATQTVYQQLLAVGVDLNKTPLGSLPVIPLDTVQRAAALALGRTLDPFAGAALIATANDFKNPRSYQAGLGIETEAMKNLIVGAQFNYVNTVHLQRNVDYNLPAPFVKPGDLSNRPNFGLRTGTLRPISSLGSITARASSARSMYRGVTFSGQYRVKRVTAGAFYTWSQSYSDDDTERDATGFNYMDPFNFKQDYTFSRFDIRHQLASYAVVDLPWGFQVSGSLRVRSGLPINPVTGSDNNEDFGNNDRPMSAPGVLLGRNSFRNRAVTNNDLRVMKNFRLGSDTRRLQFSAEFFNLMNLDNVVFDGPNGSVLTGGVYGNGIGTNGAAVAVDPRFMRLRLADGTYDKNNSQSGTPLQVQFGLRFFF